MQSWSLPECRLWFDDTTKPGSGHLIPDGKGHCHVAHRLLPASNRSNIFDGLTLCVKVLYQGRHCVSSLPPGRKLAQRATISLKLGTINQPIQQTQVCVPASAPDQAFGVIPNTKLILVETQKELELDIVDVWSSHQLATWHFLSVATQLTSFNKYVVKNFREKKNEIKTTKTFFPSLYASNRCNWLQYEIHSDCWLHSLIQIFSISRVHLNIKRLGKNRGSLKLG